MPIRLVNCSSARRVRCCVCKPRNGLKERYSIDRRFNGTLVVFSRHFFLIVKEDWENLLLQRVRTTLWPIFFDRRRRCVSFVAK